MGIRHMRRRQIIVDRKMQLGIAFRIVFFLAAYLVLFYLMAVFAPFLMTVLGGGTEMAVLDATRRIVTFVDHLLIPLVLTFTCLALHTILISHRVAGPAFRLRKTFESMEDGDLGLDIRLRSGDYLTDVADSYNRMIAILRADVAAIREEAEGLVAAPEDAAQVHRRAERLVEIAARWRTGEAPADAPVEVPAGVAP